MCAVSQPAKVRASTGKLPCDADDRRGSWRMARFTREGLSPFIYTCRFCSTHSMTTQVPVNMVAKSALGHAPEWPLRYV
jgi:hypothetical protein